MNHSERLAAIDAILKERYPETTALAFTSGWTLLVAAVLAAQCTDERVNMVTATLFDRFPDPAAFAEAELETIEMAVHSSGFYRQKAKTLRNMNAALVVDHGGAMPETLDELVKLPGIGRKTAQLVLGNACGKPGVFVDTHVKRLAVRMGFSTQKDPDKIELDLAALIEPVRRTAFSNLLTHLGRAVCTARKAKCGECPVAELCPKVGVA